MARDDASGTRSLAGGAIVETRLCARLLGVKLLVVDGAITLWPAQPIQPAPAALTIARPGPGRPAGERLEATADRLEGTAQRLRRLRT